jgi:uncharacterized phage protein (TIGR01671 family)
MEDRYLFKAKRSDNGEWEIGSLIALPTGEYEISNKCNNPPDCDPMWDKVVITHKVDPSTISQCTGLKDTNGTPIWENDIMVAHLDDAYPEDETYIRIMWHGNGFCSKEKGSEEVTPFDKFDQEHFEVCGNIFDNAELLGRNDE